MIPVESNLGGSNGRPGSRALAESLGLAFADDLPARPTSAEFVERIPNWAIPLAFLWVRGFGHSRQEWLS